MHGNLELILTLTCGLAAALALGYVTHRLGLSPILGYLIAGILVGPHTPGYVANWDWSAGIVFGLAISVASTVVLTRVLSDNRDLHSCAKAGWRSPTATRVSARS